jgi:hypothetical protein
MANQAAPARGVVSPATVTPVVSSPQIRPLMNCTCGMRSSPVLIGRVEPFCSTSGGRVYGSEATSLLVSTGMPPCATRSPWLIAQTPMRWSPVPLKSGELKKHSAPGRRS